MKNIENLRKVKESITKECNNFVLAMTQLAHGQVNVAVGEEQETLDTASFFNKEYVSIINVMMESLRQAEAEFNKITEVQSKRMVYVGGDLYKQGQQCAHKIAELTGKKGKVAITTGHMNSTGLELRRKGFINCLKDNYPSMTFLEINENKEDPLLAKAWFMSLYKREPEIKGIYITEGATPWGIGEAIAELGLEDNVMVVAHDMSDETIDYIKKGAIKATANDNTYTQGYDPIIHVYNKIAAGWNPGTAQQLVEMDLVTRDNLKQFWSAEEGIIQSSETRERLAKPMSAVKDTKVKIGVISRDESAFWHVVKDGVMAAKMKLEPLNAEVHWYEVTRNLIDAEPYIDLINKAISDGCNGLAVIAINSDIIPHINKVVDKGIPVATFVTEPSSLRNLLYELNNQTINIESLTHVLRSNQQDTTDETSHIITSVKDISKGTDIQNGKFVEAKSEINSLREDIEEINNIANKSSEANSQSVQIVIEGSGSVEASLTNIKEIEESITRLWHNIEALTQESLEITQIVDIISDITEQINILSINAAIESARAGEEGKGFLVISGEIRKLASETGKATQSITSIIERIKENTVRASEEIGISKNYINRSSKISDVALTSLQKIKSHVDEDNNRGSEIAQAINRVKELADRVNVSMTEIAEISSNHTDSIHTMSKSLDTVGDKLKNVESLIIELEKIAVAGKTIMSNFTI